VRETLEKLQGKSNKGRGAKNRREKRDKHREQTEIDQQIEAAESKIIKVTEFVTASEMATMMDVGVTTKNSIPRYSGSRSLYGHACAWSPSD